MPASPLGYWSSSGIIAVGIAYALALAAGFTVHGFHEPIADPILAIMEILTILSALPIVTLMAAVHEYALPKSKVYGLLALIFSALCAGITCTIHFVELSASRQMGRSGIVWPSAIYAAELLAWDIFLGLALVCAALVFQKQGPQHNIRRTLFVCGILCLLGIIGPLLGNMRLQLVGVLGYALVLPIAAWQLARYFRAAPPPTQNTS